MADVGEIDWRTVIDHSTVGLVLLDDEGRVRFATAAAARICPVPVGRPYTEAFPPPDDITAAQWLAEVRGAGADRAVFLRAATAVGGRRRSLELVATNLLEEPGVQSIVVHAHDVTGQADLVAQLTTRAFFDALTGLPNRTLLYDRLEQARSAAGRTGTILAVVFLDLDRFKMVNDRLGHHVGDEVLRVVAGRLGSELREGATVARIGGDEFAVVLPESSAADAVAVADRLLTTVARPIGLSTGETVAITASAGVATNENAYSNEAVLARADAAMYTAKSTRRANAVVAYGPSIESRQYQQLAQRRDLEELRRENIKLAQQAKIDAITGVPNVRSYLERSEALHVEAVRTGTVYSLVFCDVDRFGTYNKHRGQQAGDDALRQVATAVAGALRSGDKVYRRGGEELVVLLPATGARAAARLSERVRAAVEKLQLPHGAADETPVVTVSVGVATFDPPRHAAVRDVEADADRAMVTAKESGRNRVVSSPTGG